LNDKTKLFIELYDKFKRGTSWINHGYTIRGWSSDSHNPDPKFETDVWHFFHDIVDPMDELWRGLSTEEKDFVSQALGIK
jgi:hypothetical protein